MRVTYQFRKTCKGQQRGYILLTLMLAVALLAIGAAAMAPEFVFQMKRDREEEMIHRGVQYSRAIRRYYKKFGRYPTRVEELENTSNVRFLRQKYKDPITGKDFRFLHLTDVQALTMGAMAGGAAMGAAGATGFGANGQMGAGMAQQAAMAQASMAQAAMAMAQTGATQNPFGGASNSGSPGSGSSNSSDSETPAAKGGSFSLGKSSSSGDSLSGQVFGGGPIVGVASISKAETIREFNSKNHYKDWQFIYSPIMDRGGLITGPFQPNQGGLGGGGIQGASAIAGQPQQVRSGFGQQGQSGFGQQGQPSGQSSFGQSSFGSQQQQQPQAPASVPEQ